MLLKKQALSSVKWTFLEQFGTQIITFIVSIFLARLLSPEEFGLIATLSVFIGIGNILLNGGMSSSLIRTKEINEEDYSTIFYFNLVISILVYAIIYLASPYIAKFYNQDILIPLIKFLSLIIIINAFGIIQQTRLTRMMDFKTQTIVAIPSLVIGGIVGVSMAYLNYGVWSLVAYSVIKTFINTMQLWMYSGWKPSFTFNKEKFIHHISFGYKLTLSGILDTVFTNIYNVIIGRFFPIIQLGYYHRANTLQMYPAGIISSILGKVTYPLFSQIQDDDIKLKSIYKRILQMNIFITAPILMTAGVLAEPLFMFLFSEKWIEAVPYFQILLIIGIMYPIHSFNLNILTVKGRSDLFLKLELIKKIMIIVVIISSFKFGILGLLYGKVFTTFVGFFINTSYSGKFINYKAWDQIKDLTLIVALSLFTALVVLMLDILISQFTSYSLIRLIFGGIMGMMTYVTLSYFFKIESLNELIQIISEK